MASGLQRSVVSFRRQGSSGLIWDDRVLSGELKRLSNGKQSSLGGDQGQTAEKDQSKYSRTNFESINTATNILHRSRSDNGGERAFRTGKVSPVIEPPSPRVPVCGLCSAFGKQNKSHARPMSRTR